jgi:hypothetical protein
MAVLEFKTRGESVTTVVRIVDTHRLWYRLDLPVETNTGSQVWTSAKTVKPLAIVNRKF